MKEILSMKYDFLFKEVMYDQEILQAFLSDVLEIPKGDIRQIRYLNPFLRKKRQREKQGILDLLVELEDGTKVNIEIQLKKQLDWDKRSLFYLSKTYTKDAKSGEAYDRLKKCICINILDFDYACWENYHTVFRMRDKNGNDFSDLFEIHVIELTKQLNGQNVDEWIRLINVNTREELSTMLTSKNAGVRMAAMKIKKLSLSQKLRYMYEAHMKEKRDRKWIENNIRREATEAGLAEGRASGLMEGEIKGSIRVHKEIGLSQAEVVQKIVEYFHLSETEAKKEVEKYWDA